jgi:mRNA interferase HigB
VHWSMRIISKKAIADFCARNRRADSEAAEEQLRAWYQEAKVAKWSGPADIKARYKSASILKNCRVVFNICGNKYRLVARINYRSFKLYIRFIGTHKEYDKINAEEI